MGGSREGSQFFFFLLFFSFSSQVCFVLVSSLDAGGSYFYLFTHAINHQLLARHEKGSGNKVKYPVKKQKQGAASRKEERWKEKGEWGSLERNSGTEEAKETAGRSDKKLTRIGRDGDAAGFGRRYS